MQRKIFLQLFLLVIILISSILFYKTYFKNENIETNSETTKTVIEEVDQKKSDLMYDIEYISQSNNGKEYIVRSKYSKINKEQPHLILMEGVIAIINMKNSNPINISANNATYNKLTHNTKFYENIKTTYDEHIITSENVNLMFNKNLASIFNNVVYKTLNTKVIADKIEIDLITKNLQISMNDKSKKVKVINLN
tara:strand:- start:81 stop:665 length:585 start_codon:yes stop_codon:yes gene_type:complete